MACFLHLLPPPSPLALGTATAIPLLGRHRGKSKQCPKTKGQKCLPFCRCMGAPPDPTPCISYVPELPRPKAKQQETLSLGVLGKLRHKNLCFSIRNEVTEQENINCPKMRSNLHWEEMDTLGIAHIWEGLDQDNRREASTGQSCNGRLAKPVLEEFQRRQQS